MADKRNRPAARLPAGFRDSMGGAVLERQAMVEKILGVYRLYGFAPLETPVIEYLDALGKFLPDEDAPDEGVFALRDDDDQWLALRYDLTAPLARAVAQYGTELPTPYRRYQFGPVWRREKPGPSSFRQFYQCDFDTVGAGSMAVDAEACALLSESLEALGLGHGEYLIRVNNRKILTSLLTQSGVEDATQQLGVLRAVDKLDRLGLAGVTALLGEGRRDPSGDFTRGAELSPAQIDVVLAYLQVGQQERDVVLERLGEFVGTDEEGRVGLGELQEIHELLESMQLGSDRVIFDTAIVRGLGYYTGPVFEATLTFEVSDDRGRKVQVGTVAAGGRYDDLVKRFTGQDVPACGASVGVDRLLTALQLRRGSPATLDGPVLVTVMVRERMGDYQSMVNDLRAAGIPAELYLGGSGFKAQMRYADRRGCPVAVIAGGNEFDAGEVTVKDLVLGSELAKEISDRADWTSGQVAQETVGRDRLIEAVRAILGRERGVSERA